MRAILLFLVALGCGEVSPKVTEPGETPIPVVSEIHPTDASVPASEKRNEAFQEADALANSALAAANVGDLARAEQLFESAVAIDPKHHRSWFLLGQVLEMQRDSEGAANAYEQAVSLNGDDADSQFRLGKAYWSSGEASKLGRAYDALARAAQLAKGNVHAHDLLGLVCERLSRPAEAASAWTTAIATQPEFGRPYVSLGTLYLKWRHLDEAIAVLEHGVANVKDRDLLQDIYYDLGLAYGRKNLWDASIQAYTEVLRLEPTHPNALRQRGFAYADNGDPTKARADIQAFLDSEAAVGAFEVQAARQRLSRLKTASRKRAPKKATMPKSKAKGLPTVPTFPTAPKVGDSHGVGEMLIHGKPDMSSKVKVRGRVVWVYDCATELRTPKMSKREVRRILKLHPERCTRPHFQIADTQSATSDQWAMVVDVPRKIRPDELKALPRDMIESWPDVPNVRVGDEVIVTGTWALRSPLGFQNSEGLLVYGSIKHLP